MAQPEIIKDIEARIIRPTSTDNAIVRFDGTTGQVQNTANTIDDNNNTVINGSLHIPAKIIGYSSQNVYNLRLGPNVENHIDLGCDGIQAKIDSSNTASTLYLNFNGGEINIGGNLTPKTDQALNLGSATYRFNCIYSFYLCLKGSTNPWLKLDDGSSNTWYIQSVQSGNSMGFGNGWDKSLKIDNNGNVFFPGLLQNNFRLISNESVTSGTTAGLRNTLLIFGTTYGNDTAYIKTAGKLSLGDPGPQIIFNTQNSLTSGQRLALIYTDHDSIGSGNSLSLVSSESDAWFIAPTIKALTKFIGNLEGNSSTTSRLNKRAGNWYNASLGLNWYKYEQADMTVNQLPFNHVCIMTMMEGANRGFAIAGDWTGERKGMWMNQLHDDTASYKWGEWKRIWVEGNSVTSAVWNDYAECREADTIEPGYVLIETGNDTLTKSTERLSPFAGVSSDTWGFSQGETDKAKTPIAVAGRVLVYPWQDRNNYKPGDCVCAAPEGKVDIMTREEIIQYPDRIVGTVSSVPTYDKWGGGENADREPVNVNGRIWIKVR